MSLGSEGWVRVRDHEYEYEYFVAWKLDGEYEYEYESCEKIMTSTVFQTGTRSPSLLEFYFGVRE